MNFFKKKKTQEPSTSSKDDALGSLEIAKDKYDTHLQRARRFADKIEAKKAQGGLSKGQIEFLEMEFDGICEDTESASAIVKTALENVRNHSRVANAEKLAFEAEKVISRDEIVELKRRVRKAMLVREDVSSASDELQESVTEVSGNRARDEIDSIGSVADQDLSDDKSRDLRREVEENL